MATKYEDKIPGNGAKNLLGVSQVYKCLSNNNFGSQSIDF